MTELCPGSTGRRMPIIPTMPALSLAMSVDDASRALGLGRTKIYGLIAEGKLLCVKIGRRRLILRTSLDELLTPNV
jgi:excisionase family DNA binding protein